MIAISLVFAIGIVGSFVTLTEIAIADTSTDIANHIGRNDPGYADDGRGICSTQSCQAILI